MNEPLKDKRIKLELSSSGQRPKEIFLVKDKNGRFTRVESVKSAVEWLKDEIDNLYRKFPKGDIWRASNDQVCDMCEEYMKKKIAEAFPDLREVKNTRKQGGK